MTVPAHVAIIMDGNGRWAAGRGLPRAAGHRAGVEALRRTVRAAGDMGIRYLTVFAFSSENWTRPPNEITDLMGLLRLFVRRDLAELHEAGVRIRVIGRRDDLAPDIRDLLEEAESLTAGNRALNLIIAFNYGARDEIARAARSLAEDVLAGRITPDAIDTASIAERLDSHDLPDPELIIRTSGEQRLSNFLLWQAAYSEFAFLPCFWPDFTAEHLRAAVAEYEMRDRRFGGLPARAMAK